MTDLVEHRLPRAFYACDTVTVARALLGQRLVRMLDGRRLSGLICEAEAYGGANDAASHAYRRTPRSAIMYGPPGIAYVYFIYGMHHCLNAVTEANGLPGAVLIRGIMPQEGLDVMRSRRSGSVSITTQVTAGGHSAERSSARPSAALTRLPASIRGLANGPGKLCQALGITAGLNGTDLTESVELFIEAGEQVDAREVIATPRIGVHGDEETQSRLWRFVWRKRAA